MKWIGGFCVCACVDYYIFSFILNFSRDIFQEINVRGGIIQHDL